MQLQREEALRNRDSKNATILTNKINRELAARKLAASSSDVRTIKVPPATGRRLIEALDDPNGRFYVRSGMSGAVLRQEGLAQTRSEGGWELTPKGRQWAETHKVNPGKSTPPGTSKPTSKQAGGTTRDATEQRVAEAQWSRLTTAVRKHQGILGPSENGAITVHFSNGNRASGFLDQMTSAFLDVERVGDQIVGRTIRVRNPKR